MISWTYDGITHALTYDARGHPRTACDVPPRSHRDDDVWSIVQARDAALVVRESNAPTCLWCVVAVRWSR